MLQLLKVNNRNNDDKENIASLYNWAPINLEDANKINNPK